jgi:hypothetical protein
LFGVSSTGELPDLLYRSTDDGLTWRHGATRIVDKPAGYPDPLWAEAVYWQCESGTLLALVRVNQKHWPIRDKPAPTDVAFDQAEHMVVLCSTDDGQAWRWAQDLGGYGAMYPSLLRLRDGRLLLTHTQRSLDQPLGVRAVVGRESSHGELLELDFDHDVLIIDGQTPAGQSSGGGFGNTVQLDDGTLVTPYSYRNADHPDVTGTHGVHMEVARWRLPEC